MSDDTILIVGDGALAVIATVLRRHGKRPVEHLAAAALVDPDTGARIAEAPVLVAEDRGTLAALVTDRTPECLLRVPVIRGDFLWPLAGPGGPGIGIFGYADRFIDHLIATGASDRAIRDRYGACNVAAFALVDCQLEQGLAGQQARDARAGIPISAGWRERLGQEQLFAAPDRPAAGVIRMLAEALLPRLGYGPVETGLLAAAAAAEPAEELPVHPAVADHLGLRFLPGDVRFRMRGAALSFTGYVERYTGAARAGMRPPAEPAPVASATAGDPVADAEAALLGDPFDPATRNRLAELYAEDRLSAALRLLESAADAGLADAQGYALIGRYRLAIGDRRGAAIALEQARALAPERTDIAGWLAEAAG